MHASINSHIKSYINPSAVELQLFNASLNEVGVTKGQYLLKPGTHVKHEYFVVKGCLRAYYMDAKGTKNIIQLP